MTDRPDLHAAPVQHRSDGGMTSAEERASKILDEVYSRSPGDENFGLIMRQIIAIEIREAEEAARREGVDKEDYDIVITEIRSALVDLNHARQSPLRGSIDAMRRLNNVEKSLLAIEGMVIELKADYELEARIEDAGDG
jgi:hypothetical protein